MIELLIVIWIDAVHERHTEVIIALPRTFRFQCNSAAAELHDWTLRVAKKDYKIYQPWNVPWLVNTLQPSICRYKLLKLRMLRHLATTTPLLKAPRLGCTSSRSGQSIGFSYY
jgi:hypothetical protein